MTNYEHPLPAATSPPAYDVRLHDSQLTPIEHDICRLADLAPLQDAVDGVLD